MAAMTDRVGVGLLRTAAGLATVLSFGGPTLVRAPVVLLFVLIGPGAALVRLLGLRDPVAAAVLALAASIAVAMLLTEAQALLGIWSPWASVVDLAALTVMLTFIPVTCRRLAAPPAEPQPGEDGRPEPHAGALGTVRSGPVVAVRGPGVPAPAGPLGSARPLTPRWHDRNRKAPR